MVLHTIDEVAEKEEEEVAISLRGRVIKAIAILVAGFFLVWLLAIFVIIVLCLLDLWEWESPLPEAQARIMLAFVAVLIAFFICYVYIIPPVYALWKRRARKKQRNIR